MIHFILLILFQLWFNYDFYEWFSDGLVVGFDWLLVYALSLAMNFFFWSISVGGMSLVGRVVPYETLRQSAATRLDRSQRMMNSFHDSSNS